MVAKYLSGYGASTKHRSLAELNGLKWFNMGEPEFLNCVIKMSDDAQSRGVDLGIGGIWRSAAQQHALHLKQPNLSPDSGGSYHEECCPTSNGLRALAVDFLTTGGTPVKNYIIQNAPRFKLVSLHDYKGEYWHCQPLAIPRSRRNQFNPSIHTPNLWAIPGGQPPTEVPFVCKLPQPTLKLGSKGDAVKTIQDHIRFYGCDPGSSDGYFGPKTESAMKCFQGKIGSTADGIYGPKTYANACEKWRTDPRRIANNW